MPHDQQPLLAVILAGGLSRRMGKDKSAANLKGLPLLDRVAERVGAQVTAVIVNAPLDPPPATELAVVPDTLPGHAGPLAGVLAGLRHAERLRPKPRHILSVPVDTPFLPKDLARRLVDAGDEDNAIVVASSAGRLHPVVALWPLSIADELENWLREPSNRKLQLFLAGHRVIAVDFPLLCLDGREFDPFMNLNTPADLAQAEAIVTEFAP